MTNFKTFLYGSANKFWYMTFCALQYYCNVFAQFHGSGGLSKCEGTTQEEAVKNQMIRKMITDREEVKAYYEVFTLEDKDGKLTLDHLKELIMFVQY